MARLSNSIHVDNGDRRRVMWLAHYERRGFRHGAARMAVADAEAIYFKWLKM